MLHSLFLGQAVSASEGTLRLLVVDDHRDSADSLVLLLNALGHVASAAYSGDEAVQQARSEPLDVAFLDLKMPNVNGYRLLEILRQLDGLSATKFVAVSGLADHRDDVIAAGFHHFFVKPVDLHELKAWLAIGTRLAL